MYHGLPWHLRAYLSYREIVASLRCTPFVISFSSLMHRCPFVDPCTTRTCCHTFCYECVARAIAISAHCPVDRCPLTVQDLGPADPLIRNVRLASLICHIVAHPSVQLVDELVVECPHKDAGCSHTCQRMLLPAHLKDSCKYVEVPCPEGKCSKGVLRKDIALHAHDRDALPQAEPSVAASEPQSSPADTAASDHSDDNLAAESTAVQRESSDVRPSGPSLRTDSASRQSLEDENARLRLRLSALEGVVNTLRFELQAVRRALGPWYRMEDSEPRRGWGSATSQPPHFSSVQSPPSTFATIDPLVPSRVSSSSQDETDTASASSAPPPHLTSPVNRGTSSEFAPGDDISSYFPSAEEEDVYSPDFIRTHQSNIQSPQQSAGAGPSHVRDPNLSHHSHLSGTQHVTLSLSQSQPIPGGMNPAYPSNMFSPTAYPNIPAPHTDLATIAIPPLDPSMPLPNTLASLHGSIASLAGALGALATTRAQDALYTGEELRSMRAGIHGLRMQFHDMLTAQAASRDSSAGMGLGSRAGDPDSVGPGGVPIPGAPSAWTAYGPRPYGVSGFPHMPGGFTKL